MINHNCSIEQAKSGQGICKSCENKIAKGSLKVIVNGGVSFSGFPMKYGLCSNCGKCHLQRYIKEFQAMISRLEKGEQNDNKGEV